MNIEENTPQRELILINISGPDKTGVTASAGQSISTIGIDGVLYFLGFKDSCL
ncbi:MAG: hypothetical protein K2F64_06120 [Muribaculaceae bacterium]|nr:hypothetical protein [Muribaculaceae bacterium]